MSVNDINKDVDTYGTNKQIRLNIKLQICGPKRVTRRDRY
jgi:hypothetical protein